MTDEQVKKLIEDIASVEVGQSVLTDEQGEGDADEAVSLLGGGSLARDRDRHGGALPRVRPAEALTRT
jgi:hypothetical protein